MERPFGKANYIAGRAATPFVKAAGRLGPAAAGVAAISQLGNYQIDDPSVDSSAMGTLRSLGSGDFVGAGRGLSKGLIEAGMDVGGIAASAADLVTGGRASQGYNSFLRDQFGEQLRIGGMPAQAPAVPTAKPALRPTTPATPALPTNFRGNGFNDPRSTTFDNTGPSRDFTNELASVPRELPSDLRNGVIFKTKDANGRTVYSGRDVGAGAQFADGKGATLRGGGTVSTVPGMSKEQIAEIMARPSAFNPNSGLSAAQQVQYQREVENAQRINAFSAAQSRASSLRQPGQNQLDPSRLPGESRSAYATRVNAMVGMRGQDFGEIQDVRRDGTARRGQDLNYGATLRGQDVQMRGQDTNARVAAQDREAQTQIAAARARQDQFNKDREFDLNATKESRAAREIGEKSVIDRVTGMLPLTGDAAKDGAMKAQALQRINQLYGQEIQGMRAALAQNPNDKQTAAQLQRLERQGLAAFAGNEEGLLRFVLGSQAADIATGDASWIPGFGNASDSQKPITSLRYKESVNPFHDGYYVTDRTLRNGKQEEIRASQVPSDIARVLRQP